MTSGLGLDTGSVDIGGVPAEGTSGVPYCFDIYAARNEFGVLAKFNFPSGEADGVSQEAPRGPAGRLNEVCSPPLARFPVVTKRSDRSVCSRLIQNATLPSPVASLWPYIWFLCFTLAGVENIVVLPPGRHVRSLLA